MTSVIDSNGHSSPDHAGQTARYAESYSGFGQSKDSVVSILKVDAEYNALLDSCDYYLSRKQWSEAENAIRKCLRKFPASPLNGMLFFNLANSQMGREDFKKAEESFTLAIIREPFNPLYLTGRASCRLADRRPLDALEDLDLILASDSLNYQGNYLKATASRLSRDNKSAIDCLRRILRYDPDNPRALLTLGEIYLEESAYKDATTVLKKAILVLESQPENEDLLSDAYFSLSLNLLYDQELADAAETIREAITRFPREGRFYMVRGMHCRLTFQNSDAEINKKLAKDYGVDSETIDQFLP